MTEGIYTLGINYSNGSKGNIDLVVLSSGDVVGKETLPDGYVVLMDGQLVSPDSIQGDFVEFGTGEILGTFVLNEMKEGQYSRLRELGSTEIANGVYLISSFSYTST